MKNFGLIGAAGYVAPRHMQAIKEVGGNLLVAFDPKDSVGIIDSHFPEASFFIEFERFDRFVDKSKDSDTKIDLMSICSPNYLHDAHVRFALRSEADAICEKPLVLNPWNLDGLSLMEQRMGRKVNVILQLRLHPSIIELKKEIEQNPDHIYDVDLTYIASRGRWYQVSWKGEVEKSGGVATNIGIHFFDMLEFLFGPSTSNITHLRDNMRGAGYIDYKRARVRWFLSIDRQDIPNESEGGQSTFRSITVDDKEIEFSGGFTDLHTESYRAVMADEGFGIDDARPSIELVSAVRTMNLTPNAGEMHPMAKPYV